MSDLVELARTRERAGALLQRRFTEGVIDIDAYDHRVGVVESATAVDEIEAVIADLAPDEGVETALVPTGTTHALAAREIDDEGSIRSVFGSVKRSGAWSVPRRLKVRSVFASGRLDLRHARLPPEGALIEVNLVFADLEILVPPGMRVTVEAEAILAEVGDAEMHEIDPTIPPLRVIGRAVVANLVVKERLPGESGWGAFWRRRRVRRLERAKAKQRALPPGG